MPLFVREVTFREIFLGKIFDPKQCARPEILKRPHPPFVDLADGDQIQGVDALPAVLARINQIRLAQDFQMLHHAEAGEVRKFIDDFGCRARRGTQQIQDRAARRIRERLPHRVEFVWPTAGHPFQGVTPKSGGAVWLTRRAGSV